MSAALAVALGVIVAAAVLSWPQPSVQQRLHWLASGEGGVPTPSAGSPRGPTSALSPAVVMELVAAALDAGLPPPAAVDAAVTACGPPTEKQLSQVVELWRLGAPTDRAWSQTDSRWQPLARCLLLAERTGASAATALRSTAADLRSARRRRARVSAHRLGVSLVLPLGLTTLPAFLLWAVVPVVLGLAEQVLISAS